jgi:hypothetical protein
MIEERRVAPNTAYVIAQKYGDDRALGMLEEIYTKTQRTEPEEGYAITSGDVANHLQDIGESPLGRWRPTFRP